MPSGNARELHSGRLLHDLTGGLLMGRGTAALDAYQAEREAESLREERDRLDAACDELGRRLSVIVHGNSRRTKLLRKALAVEDQIGVGLDGMIESLLAVVASVPTLKTRVAELEAKLSCLIEALESGSIRYDYDCQTWRARGFTMRDLDMAMNEAARIAALGEEG